MAIIGKTFRDTPKFRHVARRSINWNLPRLKFAFSLGFSLGDFFASAGPPSKAVLPGVRSKYGKVVYEFPGHHRHRHVASIRRGEIIVGTWCTRRGTGTQWKQSRIWLPGSGSTDSTSFGDARRLVPWHLHCCWAGHFLVSPPPPLLCTGYGLPMLVALVVFVALGAARSWEGRPKRMVFLVADEEQSIWGHSKAP